MEEGEGNIPPTPGVGGGQPLPTGGGQVTLYQRGSRDSLLEGGRHSLMEESKGTESHCTLYIVKLTL